MENNKTIGTLLRESRESKNLTIKEVATKTKINLNILRHLEDDRFDKLPNKTYVKGFVKNYAKIVGITQDEAIAALENTYVILFPQKSKALSTPEQTETKKKEEQSETQEKVISIFHSLVNKKALVSISVLVISVFIIKGVVAFFSQISNEQVTIAKVEKVEKPITTITESKETQKDPEIEVTDDTTIKPKESDLFELKAIQKLKDEKAKEEKEKEKVLALQKIEDQKEAKRIEDAKKKALAKKAKDIAKLNGKFPYVNFYQAPSNMYDVLEDAKENSDQSLLPNRYRRSVEAGIQNVFVNATEGDTWISYQSDDEAIKRFVLKKGRSVLIKGKVILLFMGNLNVAKIFLNNKLVNAQSKTGVKSIIFPQSEAKNYELPLFPSFRGVPMKASLYKENMAEVSVE
jgi:cytoskeletal protein RodZ